MTAGLENPSSSGMTMGFASNSKAVAISVIQGGDALAARSANKSADAWQGFYTALMSLKSCSHPSCGTPSTAMTEASLSEIGSSHGGVSPRKLSFDIEMEDDMSDIDVSDGDLIEEGCELVLSADSKRARRRGNRRRRTRGGRRSAARRAKLRAAAACDTIDEELATTGVAANAPRDVVLLSDLGFDSPSMTGVCPAESRMPAIPAVSQGTPYYSKVVAHANAAAGPNIGSDASARIPTPTSTSYASQEATCATSWVQGTPYLHMPPYGSCAVLCISPCHSCAAPVGGIVSTSPMAAQIGTRSTETVTMAGAGSPSADILRSWLHASGLPPAADIAAQLQAAAPEFYED